MDYKNSIVSIFQDGFAENGALEFQTGDRQVLDPNSVAALERIADSILVVGNGAVPQLNVQLDFDIAGYLASDTVARGAIGNFTEPVEVFGWVIQLSCPQQFAQISPVGITITGDPAPTAVVAGPTMSIAYSFDFDSAKPGRLVILYTRTVNGARRATPAIYQNTGGIAVPVENTNVPTITITSNNANVVANVWPLANSTAEGDDIADALYLNKNFSDDDDGLELYNNMVRGAKSMDAYVFRTPPGASQRYPKIAQRIAEAKTRGSSGRVTKLFR